MQLHVFCNFFAMFTTSFQIHFIEKLRPQLLNNSLWLWQRAFIIAFVRRLLMFKKFWKRSFPLSFPHFLSVYKSGVVLMQQFFKFTPLAFSVLKKFVTFLARLKDSLNPSFYFAQWEFSQPWSVHSFELCFFLSLLRLFTKRLFHSEAVVVYFEYLLLQLVSQYYRCFVD